MHFDFANVSLARHISEVEEGGRQSNFASMNEVTGYRSSDQQEWFYRLSLAEQRSFMLLYERSIVLAALENRVIENSFQETQVVVGTNHSIIPQSLLHNSNSLASVGSVGDQFSNHRVVEC